MARSPRGEVDIALKIFDAVKNALTVSGLPEEMADRYAYFAVEMYKYIEARPQPQGALQSAKSTFDGGRGGAKASVDAMAYAKGAADLSFAAVAERLVKISGGVAIAAFVETLPPVATILHIGSKRVRHLRYVCVTQGYAGCN